MERFPAKKHWSCIISPWKNFANERTQFAAISVETALTCALLSTGKADGVPRTAAFVRSPPATTGAAEYPLLSPQKLTEQAKKQEAQGVLRYSIVTSGRRLSEAEVDALCQAIRQIKRETGIYVCVSVGLLDISQFRKLKEAGAERAHNNLETSRRNFPNICTTHTFDEKAEAIRAAQEAGLSVCSGGIMGLGETVEDRIDMAQSLRELGVKSVPLNMLNPIPGTPLAQNEKLQEAEMRRIAAVYRFILPDASIRLAGGRGLLPDKGKSCFQSGANAAITGDMLTTAGITVQTDRTMLQELGYEVRL